MKIQTIGKNRFYFRLCGLCVPYTLQVYDESKLIKSIDNFRETEEEEIKKAFKKTVIEYIQKQLEDYKKL